MLRAEGFVAEPQSFTSDYRTSGTLLPSEAIDIHPEISGRVTAILFREGSVVRKGQPLLELSAADVRAQLMKLRAVRAQQASVLRRSAELVRIGGISRQDYEAAQTAVQSADADIAYQQELMRRTRVVAPFSGTVGLRGISVGAIVTPATIVASLQQVNPLKLDFSLPEQYRESVRAGTEIRFWSAGLNDTIAATVKAVDPGATATTRTVTARALVPNPGGVLAPGGFAHVIVPLHRSRQVLMVPSQAIIPTTREKKVALVRNGKVDLWPVILGERTEDKVEVTHGLEAGDTILITGIMQVKAGSKVTVTKVRKG
jgi:membrane fusion protein (multidrug efflux system)